MAETWELYLECLEDALRLKYERVISGYNSHSEHMNIPNDEKFNINHVINYVKLVLRIASSNEGHISGRYYFYYYFIRLFINTCFSLHEGNCGRRIYRQQ